MIQDMFLKDQLNYAKYGLDYALQQMREEYICKKCRTHYKSTREVRECRCESEGGRA